MPLSREERQQEIYELRKGLEALRERNQDIEAIQRGAEKGIITEDEFKFAVGFHGLDQKTPPPVPETLDARGSQRGPLRQVADHIRLREILQEREAEEADQPRILQVLGGIKDTFVYGLQAAGEASIGSLYMMAELTNAANPVQLMRAILNDESEAMQRGRIREAGQDAMAMFRDTLNLPGHTTDFQRMQRQIAGVKTGPAAEMYGEFAGLLFQILLAKNMNPASMANVGRMLTGTSAGLASQMPKFTMPLIDPAIASRTFGPGQGKEILKLAGVGAATGASTLIFSAPEDRTGMNYAFRAISGAGLFLTGGSAVIGRPYGPQARAVLAQEMMLGARSPKQAQRLLGIQATGLEQAGLKAIRERFKYGVTTGMVFSPRTTYGQLLGSGAIGASHMAGLRYSQGKPPEEALIHGVMEGGLWAGTDFLFARIGNVARATAVATLFKQNQINTLIASNVDPAKAQRIGALLSPEAQKTGAGMAGGVLGGMAGAAIGEELGGTPGAIMGATAGALAGGGAGVKFVERVHANLHTFLPRDTAIKILDGQFGKLTKEELSNAAEVMLNHAHNATVQQINDPVLGQLWKHVMGVHGENMAGGARKFLPGPRDAQQRFIQPQFSESTIAERVAAVDALKAKMAKYDAGQAPKQLGGPTTTASGAVRPMPAATDSSMHVGYAFEVAAQRAERIARKGLPAPSGPEGVLRPAPERSATTLQGHLQALGSAEKELLKLRRAAKKADKPFLQEKQLKAVRAEKKEAQAMLDEIHAVNQGIFDLPPLSSSETAGRIGRIRERQVAILNELTSLEKEFGDAISPGKLKLMGEYAALRDEYGKILELGGFRAERAAARAQEQFATRLPYDAPVAARAAVSPESPLSRVASVVNSDVEMKLALDQMLGKPRKPAAEGRRVVGEGTAVPATITPQAVSGVTRTLGQVRDFANQHGMDLVLDQETRRMALVARESGATVVEGDSITELMRRLGNLVSRGVDEAGGAAARSSEAGFSNPELAATFTGAGTGGLLGGVVGIGIQNAITDGESDSVFGPALGVLAGAAIGGAGFAHLARKGGAMLTKDAQNLIRIFKPEIKEYVSKSSLKGKFGQTNLKQESFMRLRPEDQVDHVLEGLERIASTQNISQVEKADEILKFMRKFTPWELGPQGYEQVQQKFLAASRAANWTDEQAASAWRGYLVNITTRFEQRPFGAGAASLFDLSLNPNNPISTAKGWDEMRRIFESARTVTGPEPLSHAERRAANARIREMQKVSPQAKKLTEIVTEDAAARSGTSEFAADVMPRPFANFQPTESLRSAAEHLQRTGDTEIGDILMRFYNTISEAERLMQRTFEQDRAKLNSIFRGTRFDERSYVRLILEGGSDGEVTRSATEWREFFTGHNDKLLRTADNFRAFLDDWANKHEIPADMRIEDYFPWYYSQATMKEYLNMSPQQRMKVGMTGGSAGSGIPEEKLWRSLKNRMREEKLGPIMDDPLEVGHLYAYGAARKFYLDRMLAQIDKPSLKKLMRAQPLIGKEISQWVLDLHGVPSTSTLKMQSMAGNLGLGMESMARTFGDADWARGVGQYFEDHAHPQRLANAVRGAEFIGKIAFQVSSPLVNMTQLLYNTGTDLPLTAVASGMFKLSGEAARDKLHKARQFFNPLPAAEAPATPILDAMRESGVLSQRFVKQLNWNADRWWQLFTDPLESTYKRRASTIAGSAALGGTAGFIVGDEDNRGKMTLAGALAGGAAGSYFGPLMRRALQITAKTGTSIFDAVEVLNRSASFAGGREAYLKAAKRAAEGRSGALADVLENTAVGAGAGALGGAALSDEESFLGRLTSAEALAGAAAGAGALGGFTAASRLRGGQTTSQRILQDAERWGATRPIQQGIFEGSIDDIGRRAMETLTVDDAAQWYGKQLTDMTQFRFGKGARGHNLRTPLGEMFSSLQTYTLNQLEFSGKRLGQFFQSSMKDTRIIRHVTLLFGLGGMLTAIGGAADSDRGMGYWTSRIGLGFLPFMRWRSDQERWMMESPMEAIAGPFIQDLYNTANTAKELLFNPKARQQWDVQLDNLIGDLLGVVGNATNQAEGTAAFLENTGVQMLEGAADAFRENEAARAVDRPVSTLRRGYPKQRGNASGEEAGIGGGGLGGGFGDEGGMGGGF